jgi:site-specific recombinase XerD
LSSLQEDTNISSISRLILLIILFIIKIKPLSIIYKNFIVLVKKYTKALKSNKSMPPHKLRHTYGTNLMEQSGDIHLLRTQLGHMLTTTAALYTNPEQEKAKKAAKLLGERRTNYLEKD